MPGKATNTASFLEQEITTKIKEFKIAKIGEHPEGFDTCKYNKDDVKKLTGISIYEYTLNELFKEAKSIDKKEINDLHKQVKSQISSLDSVDPKELDLSLRLKSSLDKIREKEKFNSFIHYLCFGNIETLFKFFINFFFRNLNIIVFQIT